MSVKPIPDGFNTVSVYLIVKNSVEAMEFYAELTLLRHVYLSTRYADRSDYTTAILANCELQLEQRQLSGFLSASQLTHNRLTV